jgi:hypothetical protein
VGEVVSVIIGPSPLETLYLAALLELGQIPHLDQVMGFDNRGEPAAWKHRFARSEFMKHKAKLLDWMHLHDICIDGVYTLEYSSPPLPHQDAMLTKQAAYWVGGFYQWLVKQSGEQDG